MSTDRSLEVSFVRKVFSPVPKKSPDLTDGQASKSVDLALLDADQVYEHLQRGQRHVALTLNLGQFANPFPHRAFKMSQYPNPNGLCSPILDHKCDIKSAGATWLVVCRSTSHPLFVFAGYRFLQRLRSRAPNRQRGRRRGLAPQPHKRGICFPGPLDPRERRRLRERHKSRAPDVWLCSYVRWRFARLVREIHDGAESVERGVTKSGPIGGKDGRGGGVGRAPEGGDDAPCRYRVWTVMLSTFNKNIIILNLASIVA